MRVSMFDDGILEPEAIGRAPDDKLPEERLDLELVARSMSIGDDSERGRNCGTELWTCLSGSRATWLDNGRLSRDTGECSDGFFLLPKSVSLIARNQSSDFSNAPKSCS